MDSLLERVCRCIHQRADAASIVARVRSEPVAAWPPWTTIEARIRLDNYCKTLDVACCDQDIKQRFAGFDLVNIQRNVLFSLAWLDANQHATQGEVEAKLQLLEEVANPIMLKVYDLSVEIADAQHQSTSKSNKIPNAHNSPEERRYSRLQ